VLFFPKKLPISFQFFPNNGDFCVTSPDNIVNFMGNLLLHMTLTFN